MVFQPLELLVRFLNSRFQTSISVVRCWLARIPFGIGRVACTVHLSPIPAYNFQWFDRLAPYPSFEWCPSTDRCWFYSLSVSRSSFCRVHATIRQRSTVLVVVRFVLSIAASIGWPLPLTICRMSLIRVELVWFEHSNSPISWFVPKTIAKYGPLSLSVPAELQWSFPEIRSFARFLWLFHLNRVDWWNANTGVAVTVWWQFDTPGMFAMFASIGWDMFDDIRGHILNATKCRRRTSIRCKWHIAH